MLVHRQYLGLKRQELAGMLNIRPQTLSLMEDNRQPIPEGIWKDLDRLIDAFDRDVARLGAQALESEDVLKVRLWRTPVEGFPPPGWWQRVVAEVMRQFPDRIEPVYPEDDKDD